MARSERSGRHAAKMRSGRARCSRNITGLSPAAPRGAGRWRLPRSTVPPPCHWCVGELHFVCLTVPRIAAHRRDADRHAQDDRDREVIAGPAAQRAAVVDLSGGRLGVLTELDLRHGQESGQRHAYGAAHEAFFWTASCRTRGRRVLLKSLRDTVATALPDVGISPLDSDRRRRGLDDNRRLCVYVLLSQGPLTVYLVTHGMACVDRANDAAAVWFGFDTYSACRSAFCSVGAVQPAWCLNPNDGEEPGNLSMRDCGARGFLFVMADAEQALSGVRLASTIRRVGALSVIARAAAAVAF